MVMIFKAPKTVTNNPYMDNHGNSYSLAYSVLAMYKDELVVPEVPLVSCKDFIDDTLGNYSLGALSGRFCTGVYAGTKHTLPKDRSYLFVRSGHNKEITLGIKKLLNPAEKRAGLLLTEVHETDTKYCIVISGDPAYFRTIFMANMWFMLIRMMMHTQKTDSTLSEFIRACADRNCKDSSYLRNILSYATPMFAEELLNTLKEITVPAWSLKKRLENVEKVDCVHSNGGIKDTIRFLHKGEVRPDNSGALLTTKNIKILRAAITWKRDVQEYMLRNSTIIISGSF